MDRNTTNFAGEIRRYFETHKPDEDSVLHYHQWLVVEYARLMWVENKIANPPKGLILNQEMGLGKTITAISVADLLRKELGLRVIVIGPKSLSPNFEVNRRKLEQMTGKSVLVDYKYYTSRANNLPEQIKKGEGSLTSTASLTSAFENCILVFDEWHLIANSIAHGRRVAVEIYRAAFAAKNCYKIMMTGTLVINSPFEAVPAFNLALGKAYFPEDIETFNAFCGSVDLQIRNRGAIQNAVSGIMSYVPVDKQDENFPQQLKTKIIALPMSGDQLARYNEARITEKKEGVSIGGRRQQGNGAKIASSFAEETGGSSSYRVRSRIESNGDSKLKWITELVAKYSHELICIQSPFVENGGCRDIARRLSEALGYKELIIGSGGEIIQGPPEVIHDFHPERRTNVPWNDLPTPPLPSTRYYYVMTGENNTEQQLSKFNQIVTDYRNRFGLFCHVLIASGVGTTGHDFTNGRHVVYTSPFFQLEEFNQLKARYIRYGASNNLRPEDRTVQPYILVSTAPRVNEESPEPSTDEAILAIAMDKMAQNSTFMKIIREVSLECLAGVANERVKCRTCLATGSLLTFRNFTTDTTLPNPCVEAKKQFQIAENDLIHDIFVASSDSGERYYIKTSKGAVMIGPAHPLYDLIQRTNSELKT